MKNTITKIILIPALFFMTACASDSGDVDLNVTYKGILSGEHCWTGEKMSADVEYDVAMTDLTEGSGVVVSSPDSEIKYYGEMTDADSFETTLDVEDTRNKLFADDITPEAAYFTSIGGCFSFRCCNQIEGVLTATEK